QRCKGYPDLQTFYEMHRQTLLSLREDGTGLVFNLLQPQEEVLRALALIVPDISQAVIPGFKGRSAEGRTAFLVPADKIREIDEMLSSIDELVDQGRIEAAQSVIDVVKRGTTPPLASTAAQDAIYRKERQTFREDLLPILKLREMAESIQPPAVEHGN